MLTFHAISLFPELFAGVRDFGVTGRAFARQQWNLVCHNPRDYVHDVHKTVDDRPYGGGPGMVMKYQPLADSVEGMIKMLGVKPHLIYLSPQGQPLTQAKVSQLAGYSSLALLCGRYEGIDERFIEQYVDEEISIGDFVVSGGELPAMLLMDAVVRLLPSVLNDSASAEEDSFSDGLLDCPHYTRPPVIAGRAVPNVLQSGDHAKIARWRLKQKLQRTQKRRPELLDQRDLSALEQKLLREVDS